MALTACSAVEGLAPSPPAVHAKAAIIVGGSRTADGSFWSDPPVVDATGNAPAYYADLQRCRARTKRSTVVTAEQIRRSIDAAIGPRLSEGLLVVRVKSDAAYRADIASVNHCLAGYGRIVYE